MQMLWYILHAIGPTSEDYIRKFSQRGVGLCIPLQGFESGWFHLQDLCNADVLTRDFSGAALFNKTKECISKKHTLGSNVHHLDVVFGET